MKDFFNDDKNLVILAVLILGLFVLWVPPDKESLPLLTSILSGLFGIAVGRATKNNDVTIKKETKENEEN